MDAQAVVERCTALIVTIEKTTPTLTSFCRRVREARSDVDPVVRELASLTTTLECLSADISDSSSHHLRPSLIGRMAGVLGGCHNVILEIVKTIAIFNGKQPAVAIQWASTGRGDMEKLCSTLEAQKTALGLGLDMLLL